MQQLSNENFTEKRKLSQAEQPPFEYDNNAEQERRVQEPLVKSDVFAETKDQGKTRYPSQVTQQQQQQQGEEKSCQVAVVAAGDTKDDDKRSDSSMDSSADSYPLFAPDSSWVCSPEERKWDSVVVGISRNDPITMYYKVFGPKSAKEKLVFIMGHSGSGDFWHYQVEYFERLGCFEIVIFDNRGIGQTTSTKGFYTTTQMACDAIDLIDHLGWKKYHVVGMSLGGMIAQEMSILRKEQIKSLCLIVTHNGDLIHSIPTTSAVNLIGQLTFASNNNDRADLCVRALYGPIIVDNETLRKKFYDFHKHMIEKILHSFNVFGYIGQSSAVARHRVSKQRFETIKKKFPITIIGSTDDIMVRSENANVLASILEEEVTWLPSGYGHNVNFACPTILNQYLHNHYRPFLSQTPSSPSSPSSPSFFSLS